MDFKILIVDDLPENIKLLANILTSEGYSIEYATGGLEAIECLRAEKFDLILLDVMMPDLNGFETCRIIKKDPELTDIPVIFLTAISDIDSLKEGFRVGGIDYITKPFHGDELTIRISTQLELKKSREELNLLNSQLEQKVEERTNQLSNANKKLEAANEELKKLEDAKNTFLKIISHELRTPLNSILGFTELIRENPDEEDLPLLLDGLNRAAWRLEKLSYTALNITKLNLNTDQLEFEDFSLAQVTVNALNTLKSGTNGINCVFFTKNMDPNIKIFGERNLIQQCVFNILENTNQHAKNCSIDIDYNHEGNIILTVTDDGPGYTKEVLKNPFKMFAPGHTYISKNAGLGLALSHLIMEAHNGDIVLFNHKNGGAVTQLKFVTDFKQQLLQANNN